MRVKLLFFAVMRDIAGANETELDLADGTRAIDVWSQLRARHRELAAYEQPPLTAINESYVDADAALREGDELVFIPPVAGG